MKSIAWLGWSFPTLAEIKVNREEEKSVSRGASLFDSRRTVFNLLL
jgi:hypothetical protein